MDDNTSWTMITWHFRVFKSGQNEGRGKTDSHVRPSLRGGGKESLGRALEPSMVRTGVPSFSRFTLPGLLCDCTEIIRNCRFKRHCGLEAGPFLVCCSGGSESESTDLTTPGVARSLGVATPVGGPWGGLVDGRAVIHA